MGVFVLQRSGTSGATGEPSYQQLLGTDGDDADISPSGNPALMRGFRRHRRHMTRKIGGGVESLWKHVRGLCRKGTKISNVIAG